MPSLGAAELVWFITTHLALDKALHGLPRWHSCCCKSFQWCLTLATLRTIACQAALSMGLSRQEYWSEFPGPPPGDLPNPGINYHLPLVVKSLPANDRDIRDRFNPWVGKMPWRRPWQPTPVFLPGESMDRGARRAMVHRVAESWTRLKWLSTLSWSLTYGRPSNVCCEMWMNEFTVSNTISFKCLSWLSV